MPLSYQSITNPSSTSFTVSFEFLNLADIKAVGKLNSTSEWTELPVTDAATSNGVTTVTVADAGTYSSAGEVRIYRATSQAPLVDFQNGSRLSESDLDTAYRQGLFAAQEVRENASDTVTAVGPQGPAGAAGANGADGTNGVDGADGTSASNSPSFWVTTGSDQSIAGDTTVKLDFDTETLDTDNAFDTTNNKFCPQVAGTYWVYVQARFNNNADADQWKIEIHKNGAAVSVGSTVTRTQQTAQVGSLVQFNGSSDYIDFHVYHSQAGTNIHVNSQAEYTYAQGFKLA